MKKQLISIGLSLIFILSLSLVQANNSKKGQRGEFKGKGHHGMMHEKLITEEQKEIFKEIRLTSMKESKPIQDELRELKAQHQTLMTAEKPDLNKIYASIDKMSELKTQLTKIKAKSRVEMASHLTEEQKLKMAHFHKFRKEGKHNHCKRPGNKGWNE